MVEAARGFFDEFPIERVGARIRGMRQNSRAKMSRRRFLGYTCQYCGKEGDVNTRSKKRRAIRRLEHTRQKLIYRIGALAKSTELYTSLREVL